MRSEYRWRVLAVAFALTCALGSLAPSTATSTPFRGARYTVEPKYVHTIHFDFSTSRDLRWVTASKIVSYRLDKCRLNGRRVVFWMNFLMPRRMRLTRDGRFSRLGDWPHLTGRFSSDGSKISVRVWLYAAYKRERGGVLRCPAHEIRFQAIVYLPAGDYEGTTAQGHQISFTLGGTKRMQVSHLAFGVTMPCSPAGSVTHTYTGLSGSVEAGDPDALSLSIDQPFDGGTRYATVRAEWLGANVTGHVSGQWLGPEPSPEEETSQLICDTAYGGVPFTAKLVRRAPGT